MQFFLFVSKLKTKKKEKFLLVLINGNRKKFNLLDLPKVNGFTVLKLNLKVCNIVYLLVINNKRKKNILIESYRICHRLIVDGFAALKSKLR